MMRKYLGVITATILSGTILGCSSDSTNTVPPALGATALNDTAELDKAYVPALFYSNLTAENMGNVQDAANTLDGTSTVWAGYKATYADYLDWDAYFGSVDANITTASDYYAAIASYPADLTTAHTELESMRDTWSDLRTDNGIEYFFDNVTAAHHSMETVDAAFVTFSAIATPVTSDVLALQTALGDTLPAFSADWDALVTSYGDGNSVNEIYSLGAEKAAVLAANISNDDPEAPGMKQIVASLNAVVETCDSSIYLAKGLDVQVAANVAPTTDCDTMISLAEMVKKKFVPVFLAFGDFINPFMADIIASNKAIIPAMYCTGNPPDAEPTCGGHAGTINLLNAYAGKMGAFGAHFPMSLVGGLNWATDMMAAQAKLAEAMTTVGAAADLAEAKANGAHAAIEAISSAMYHICATYENHVTIMTRMNEYHSAFEAIVAIAAPTGAAESSLTAQQVDDINALMPALQTAFANMGTQVDVLDYAAWGLTAGDLDVTLAAQNTNVVALVDDLAAYDATNDNSGDIAVKSLDLKKKYIPFFKLLGDFTQPK